MRRGGPEVPRATLAALTVLAVGRAGALLLIAEGFAHLIADFSAPATGAALAAVGLLLRSSAGWGTAAVGRRAAALAKRRDRAALVRGVVERDLDAGSVAVLASRGLDAGDSFYTAVVPAAVAAIVVPLGLAGRVLLADPLSALILAVTLPLVPVFMILIGLHSRDRVARAQSALARLADHIAELARGLPVLVGLGRDREQAERLSALQRDSSDRTRGVLRTAFLSALALELVATLSVAVVAVVLGIRLLGGDVGLFEALVVLLLAPECFAAIRELGIAHHAADDGRDVRDRVRGLLAGAPAPDRRRHADAVSVSRLAVRYPGRRRAAVSGVSLRVEPGEIVALAGASGAGKSSILATLAGVLPVGTRTRGVVEAPPDVAWVPQDPRCLAADVRSELAHYAAGAPVDGVLDELGLAGLGGLAPHLLSPGELRRVAVARALVRVDRGARLLLLDEPTAHLDPASAAAVRAAVLRRAPHTAVVLVSHDPATLALAHRAVALDAHPVAVAAESLVAVPEAPAPHRDSPIPAHGRRTALAAVLRPAGLLGVAAVLLGVAATGMGLALTAVSAWLIVRAAEQPAVMYLLVAIVGVRFFGLGRAVARYAERLVTHRVAFRVVDDLRLRLWHGMSARGAASRDLREGGRAVDHLIGTAGEVRDALPRTMPPLIVGALTALGVAATVFLVAPGAAPLAAGGLLIALAAPVGLAVLTGRRAEVDRVRRSSSLLRGIAALGAASRDLRANGVAVGAIAEVEEMSRRTTRAEWRSGLVADAGVQLAPLIAGLTAVAAAAALAGTGEARATVAVVGLVVLATGESLAAAVAGAHRLPALLAALAPLADVLAPVRRPARGGVSIDGPVRELLLDGLAVGWDSGAPIATGVHARVRRGEVLFVRGPSGSGKTTLLTTLLGDLPARAGRVEIDGIALEAIDPAAWRSRVAWCPQEAHVFDSTLRGNLMIGRPRSRAATDDDLNDVLHRVGLTPLVDALDDGLDGRVGPGGRWLSGGERQRLAVARTLLGDADVVLLDEPTAHLDAPTAAEVMADLRRALADRIVVIVSHRAADRGATDVMLDLGQPRRSSSAGTWPATNSSRALATGTHAARSISGNDAIRPDPGGHSISNSPPRIAPGSKPVPSAANTVRAFPEV